MVRAWGVWSQQRRAGVVVWMGKREGGKTNKTHAGGGAVVFFMENNGDGGRRSKMIGHSICWFGRGFNTELNSKTGMEFAIKYVKDGLLLNQNWFKKTSFKLKTSYQNCRIQWQ